MHIKIKCPYCGKLAECVTGKEVYPHIKELEKRRFWLCSDCDAYVGCHLPCRENHFKDNIPFGRISNKELRQLKVKTHQMFDAIWIPFVQKDKKRKSVIRNGAYKWLARKMKISPLCCHIGNFSVEQCKEAIEIVTKNEHPNL